MLLSWLKKLKHSCKRPSWVFKIFETRGGSDFSDVNGGVGKIGEVVLQKQVGYHLFLC